MVSLSLLLLLLFLVVVVVVVVVVLDERVVDSKDRNRRMIFEALLLLSLIGGGAKTATSRCRYAIGSFGRGRSPSVFAFRDIMPSTTFLRARQINRHDHTNDDRASAMSTIEQLYRRNHI
jgi:hypothetical protein